MDVGDGKWKQVLGVFKTWKLKFNGNMIISFNLWEPQFCLVMSCQCTQQLSLSQTLFFLFSFLSFYSPHLHSSFFLLHRVSTDHSVSSSSPSNLHCSSTNHQLPLPQATTTNLLVQAQPRIENPKIFLCHQLN